MKISDQNSANNCKAMDSLIHPLYIEIFTQPLPHKWDVTQGNLLSEVQLLWIQIPLSKLVVEPGLKNSICLAIYS